jgi:hypothetical protein
LPLAIGIKDPLLIGYIFTPLEIMPRCSAAGLDFRIIPAGFNAPLEFLTGFALVWFIYALLRLVTVFLIRPGLKIKGSRRNGVTVVKLELLRKDSE